VFEGIEKSVEIRFFCELGDNWHNCRLLPFTYPLYYMIF